MRRGRRARPSLPAGRWAMSGLPRRVPIDSSDPGALSTVDLGRRLVSARAVTAGDAGRVVAKIRGESEYTSPVQQFAGGANGAFLVPIGAFASTVPLAGPAQIELLEQAEGGATHLLGTLAWTPPQRATPPLPGPGG